MATATLVGGYTYTELTITDIDPTSGPTTGGTACTVTGTGFQTDLNIVTLGGIEVNDLTIIDDGTLSFTSPPSAAGLVDLVISQNSITVTLADCFTYVDVVPLSITSIAPNSGPETGGTSVVVYGNSFTETTSITVGSSPLANQVLVDENTITGDTLSGVRGYVDVTAVDGDVTFTMPDGYFYSSVDLSVVGISPNADLVTGGASVTISGSNFDETTTVTIGDSLISAAYVESSSTIIGTCPEGTEGTVNVVVTKGAESIQLTDAFIYVSILNADSIDPTTASPS